MPALIPEVLERIASEFRYHKKHGHPEMEEIQSNSNDLIKFMLSGRKPFNSTLTYFSRADKIAVWNEFFIVIVKNFTTDRFNTLNKHYFPYDFILKKSLLNALCQSNGTLEIHEEINGQNSVLDALLTSDLKKITLFENVGPKYFNIIKTKCSLEKIRVSYKHYSTFDFCDIPASCHEIVCSTTRISFLKGLFRESSTFPQVKELNIFWMELDQITSDELNKQSRKIVEKYPKLEKLYIVYSFSVHEHNIRHIVASIQPQAFQAIPAHIHGIIHFEADIKEDSYKNVVQELRNDPSVKIDPIKKQFTKNLKIHDYLFVIFKINTHV